MHSGEIAFHIVKSRFPAEGSCVAGRAARRGAFTSFLSFERAREIARKSGLRKAEGWCAWHKQNRPRGVPARSDVVYANSGWAGYGDFLGYASPYTGRARRNCRPRRFCLDESSMNQDAVLVAHERYKARGFAINLVRDEIRKYKETANSTVEIDVAAMPLGCLAQFLFRIRTSAASQDGQDGDADRWMPLVLRYSTAPPVRARITPRNSIAEEASPTAISGVTSSSSSATEEKQPNPLHYRFNRRCGGFKQDFLQCGPVLCVAPQDRKVFGLDSKEYFSRRGRGSLFSVSPDSALSGMQLCKFLQTQWEIYHQLQAASYAEWLEKSTTSPNDATVHRGLMILRDVLYKPLGYDLSFGPHEHAEKNLCNSYLGSYRTVHRKAILQSKSIDCSKQGIRVLLEGQRIDGIVFSGPGTNIHLIDFLIVFHSGAPGVNSVDGLFIFPRKAIEANLNTREDNYCPSFSVYPPFIPARFSAGERAKRWQAPYYIDLTDVEADREKAAAAVDKARKIFEAHTPVIPDEDHFAHQKGECHDREQVLAACHKG
ncbi:unnamed protein product [Amoebophrya sp. A120]|nr:unnamed protein product [Amoebophrya sp. A120]|eukprot:GSA120T00021292001.1